MSTILAVKELRTRTGVGIVECRNALAENDGDMEKAIETLRVRAGVKDANRSEKAASEGLIESYIHATGKIGVLVEIDCETDFVARGDLFREFSKDVALHIAATNPLYLSEEDVPTEEREQEYKIALQQVADKPEAIRGKIAEGKIRKWLEQITLLGQSHINTDKYTGQTIEEIRKSIGAQTGERVVIRRFQRFEIGE